MLSGAAIIFIVNVFSSVLKLWVYPKYGKLGVQVMVFFLAVLGGTYYMYKHLVPGLEAFVVSVLGVFSLSVAFYEVILSHLDIFKVKTDAVETARAAERG